MRRIADAALGRAARGVALAGVLLLLVASSAGAAEASFALPIGCTPGRDCHVQNYVDQEPGPGARDYACGFLTYDGHKGTDIRIPDLVAMARGVAVYAAAPGVVRAVRDGMPDESMRNLPPELIESREAGNGVIIDHEGGWQTLYAHMRRGSVLVRPGDRVTTGQRLGLVGLSGQTEFPHLHFEVRRDGKVVDPFTGAAAPSACGQAGHSLWTEAAKNALAYVPSGIVRAGFAGRPVAMKEVERGDFRDLSLSVDAPALVFWVLMFGARAGDTERMEILAPDGTSFARDDGTVGRTQAQRFRFVGKRRRTEDWAQGRYTARYLLVRDGIPVIERQASVEVR